MTDFNIENPVLRALRNGVFREFKVDLCCFADKYRYLFDVEFGSAHPDYTAPYPFYLLHWLTSEVWKKKIQTLIYCIPPSISHIFEKRISDVNKIE